MRKIFTGILFIFAGFILGACAVYLPQGTFVKADDREIQSYFNKVPDSTAVVKANVSQGEQQAILEIFYEFLSLERVGAPGGVPCKAYRLVTQGKEIKTETGVMCQSLDAGGKWEHRPWKEYEIAIPWDILIFYR